MAGRQSSPGLEAHTVRRQLIDAVESLRKTGVGTPILDAEVMLSRATGRTRIELIAHPEYRLSPDVVECFADWVQRRAAREPLAYILGEKEFYGICFEVTPAVLIPRPETELLVETARIVLQNVLHPVVVDVGTGSGALAITIAKILPEAVVYGTDASSDALEVACRNAVRAGVGDRVHLLKGDLLSPLAGMSFDLVVSNPPYIPSVEIDALEPEVTGYEPREALDGGPDGLDCYRRLAAEAPAYVKSGGVLAVEIGMRQAEAVKSLFTDNGFSDIHYMLDLAGVERIVYGMRRSDATFKGAGSGNHRT